MGRKQIVGLGLCSVLALVIVVAVIWFPWVTATQNRMLALAATASVAAGGAVLLFRTVGRQWIDKGFLQTSEGKPFHWPKDVLPLSVWFHPELSVGYRDLWITCVHELEVSIGLKLFKHPDQAIPEMVMLWDKPDTVWPLGVLVMDDEGTDPERGVTHHWVDHATGKMLSAKVVCPEQVLKQDRALARKLVAHELRHVVGLDHDSGHGMVMHPQLGTAEYSDHPDDIDRLKKLYG